MVHPNRLNIEASYSKKLKSNKTIHITLYQDKKNGEVLINASSAFAASNDNMLYEKELEETISFIKDCVASFKQAITLNTSYLEATKPEANS